MEFYIIGRIESFRGLKKTPLVNFKALFIVKFFFFYQSIHICKIVIGSNALYYKESIYNRVPTPIIISPLLVKTPLLL